MASKPIKTLDSRSMSVSLAPERLQSRRGSVASISTTTHIDKDTLSHALDQIHTAASQTTALTTFNEYTAPPTTSSNAIENKGLSVELQGGISGLYNRLKASVGNAKDNTTADADSDSGERSLLKVSGASRSSPATTLRDQDGVAGPSQAFDLDQGAGTLPIDTELRPNISNDDTVEAVENSRQEKSPNRPRLLSAAPSSKSARSIQKIVKPSRADIGTVGAVSSAEQNVGAVESATVAHTDPMNLLNKSTGNLQPPTGSAGERNLLLSVNDATSNVKPQVDGPEESRNGAIQSEMSSDPAHSPGLKSSWTGGPHNRQKAEAPKQNTVSAKNFGENSGGTSMADTNYLENVSTLARDSNDTRNSNLPSPSSDRRKSTISVADRKGKPQHIGLPPRKSLAPPLVSKQDFVSGVPISRTSSTDTNVDSMPSSARRGLQSDRTSDIIKNASQTRPINITTGHPLTHDPRSVHVFSQARNKVLNKEYWMKDENARDCFNCGDPFTTFRRKHHCRICGQIFDAKCTSTIAGERFGHSGTLRVCLPCEGFVTTNDESSDLSEAESIKHPILRPRLGSASASDIFPSSVATGSPPSLGRPVKNRSHTELIAPTMSIPAARKAGERARRSTVLEIGGIHSLARPSSSKSLKSAFSGKPVTPGHRRHNSRHQAQRSFKALREDDAPFHQEVGNSKLSISRLPAFHDDNIIDPDLAPYLSDEASSGDEQMNIMAALNGDNLSRSHEMDRNGMFPSAIRRGRSKLGEKSLSAVTFASRDTDNHSLYSAKMANPPRSAKRRNMSFSGSGYMRPSLRSRANFTSPVLSVGIGENSSISGLTQGNLSSNPPSSRMLRSSSMKGDQAPAIELNQASLEHVQRLLNQLLRDMKIPNIGAWEKALIPILLRATDDVNPDVTNGDDIDIRHYVKLKKIPGGRPGDTSYVSGLVFTKNLALKSMPRSILHPNILILTFPLEYARHQQHFMSLEPVIRQEREFLQNLVNRIAALRPHLLLVERHVSGLALEFLEQAGITTAQNVKASVLEAVSRCCQTKIISSIDKLAIKPAQAGKCANFYVKTYVNQGRKKTYMFLSGCAKELGCTIVLRGDDNVILSKMKRLTEFMIYVVYNLKLETSLMRDEFAAIPSTSEAGSLVSGMETRSCFIVNKSPKDEDVKSPKSTRTAGSQAYQSEETPVDSDQTLDREIEEKAKSGSQAEGAKISLPAEDSVPDDIPMPTFYSDMVEEHKTKILSASPFVKFMQPYLLMRAREQERRLAYLKRLRDQDLQEEQKSEEKPKVEKFDLITPEMVHEIVPNASRKVREVLRAVHDAEYDKALHIYQTQSKQWETYIAGSLDLFDPCAHQNIVVLFSVVCTTTTVPCAGPDLLALGFYNEHEEDEYFEADCTLGQYVEDLCFSANNICTSNGCEKRMIDHHRQYVHGEGQVSIFVERSPCKISGLQDTILMWSVCRVCNAETQVVGMSENTWKYSFGKYLELSFWGRDLRASAEICPHDLHRDHVRYLGFKDMALRVQYDAITCLEIIVPRTRITWKVDNDLRFKNDIFNRIEERINKFMYSVKARIKNINTQNVLPEKMDACRDEVEKLSKKAADDHHSLIQKIRKRYMNSKHFEVVPLNRAIRATMEKAAEWDHTFADFDHDYFPSDKDIRRLTTLQLRSIFLERDQSTKTGSASEDGSNASISQEVLNEKISNEEVPSLVPQTRDMSPETAQDMLASVISRHASAERERLPAIDTALLAKSGAPALAEKQEVQHLDLAIPANVMEALQAKDENLVQQDVSAGNQHHPGNKSLEAETAEAPAASDRGSDLQTPTMPYNSTPKLDDTQERTQPSAIPRPVNLKTRHTRSRLGPSAIRTQSQPGHTRSNDSSMDSSNVTSNGPSSPELDPKNQKPPVSATTTVAGPHMFKAAEKRISDRLSLAGAVAQSMIPRSITRRKDSKVSSLAKHFEQLSREFERERLKERRQRAAKNRRSRAFPMAASKPIVQVYQNFHEAVEEKEPSVEDLLSSDPSQHSPEESLKTSQAMAENQVSETTGEGFHAEETVADEGEAKEHATTESHVGTDLEAERESDEDYTIFDDLEIPGQAEEHHALTAEEAQLDLKLDLPKHEKTSLMKMLRNFWAERSASGWQPLEYPLNATDHLFAYSDIIVREDEPSSLVALAISSEDYQTKLSSISENTKATVSREDRGLSTPGMSEPDEQFDVESSLLCPTGTHLICHFSEGSAKMLCKVFYAEQFHALRRKCGVADRFVESLSRCMKWDSKGGKTKSVFLKTLDDRFVLKSLSPIETQAFLRFAPAYFRIIAESLFHDLPSVIAKMLGFYQVIIKNPVTGVEFNWFLLVMENLFYDRSPTRIFDLKGSMRNRRIQSTGEQNEVLLDENMVEFIYESPLFAREHSKKLLRASVWNDTLFLSRQNVMDYSLMIAIDEKRKELVVGIIDCIRTYTWDKKLESWIKDRGKNRPTVTSPKEYKSRFREAMGRYVLQAPNCWHQFKAAQFDMRPIKVDDPSDDKEAHVVGI